MTLLGKIFTVLIFVMSLVFMSFAVAVYAVNRNWRDVVTNTEATAEMPLGLRDQLGNAKNKHKELDRQLEELKYELAMERAARRSALAYLESHRSQLQASNVQLAAENAKLSEKETELVHVVKTTQDNLTRMNDEVVGLRGEIRDTQLNRDTKFSELLVATDTLHQMRGVHRRLSERNEQLAAQVATQKGVLEAHGLNEHTPIGGIAPHLDGKVLAVSSKAKLVEVSIGADDGLREGHELNVTRGSQFLGRIIIRRTDPDRAVGEIDPQLQKGLIQKGDRVYTKV